MLENLSYIYQAMYALDLYDSVNSAIAFLIIMIPVGWAFVWFITLMISTTGEFQFEAMWRATKRYQLASIPLLAIIVMINIIMPSKNTVKAYIGVKAVQAVGDYLDKNTDIPERSKHTMTRLWDKVDGYIESIDVEDKLEAVTDSTKAKADNLVESVKKTAGKDKVDSLVQSVKQQAIDSVLATIKK